VRRARRLPGVGERAVAMDRTMWRPWSNNNAPEDKDAGQGDREVFEPPPIRVSMGAASSGSADPSQFDYELLPRRMIRNLVRLRNDAARLGGEDGLAGIPSGAEREVPPAVALLAAHGANASMRVDDGARRVGPYLDALHAGLERQLDDAQDRLDEALEAYGATDEARLEPLRGGSEAIGQAIDPAEQHGDPTLKLAQVAAARRWHLSSVWYWVSAVILIGAEFPLSYALAESLISETGASPTLETLLKGLLAVSITGAILISVKLAGTLLRRAQTMFQLADEFERWDVGPDDGGSAVTADQVQSIRRSGRIRVVIAGALAAALLLGVFGLATYRAAAFESVNKQQKERSDDLVASGLDAEVEEGGEIVPQVNANLLKNLFLALLILNITAGVALAWASTDPRKDIDAPAPKRSVSASATVRDRQKQLLDLEVQLEACKAAMAALPERIESARQIVAAEAAILQLQYWQANHANRSERLSEEYVEWVSDRVGPEAVTALFAAGPAVGWEVG